MELVPLVDLQRGGTLENRHFGALAVADAQGRLLARAGDAHWVTFSRSTLKPLQALPFVEAGGAGRFGYGTAELALMCASHSGEPVHVATVQRMLDRIGLAETALRCGCHPPIFTELGIAAPPGLVVDQRHHNCSGKHAGFLAYCVQHGLPHDGYLAPEHPLQQAVRHSVARAVRLPETALRAGTDGCSAPNYALPLAHLAAGCARLAAGAADPEFGASFGLLAAAMAAHPELLSGAGRSDAAFVRAGRGDWLAKIGADGVQVVASRSRRQALALKIADGNMVALSAATVEALDQLGWLDARQRDELEPWRARDLRNARGLAVGQRLPAFRLQPA